MLSVKCFTRLYWFFCVGHVFYAVNNFFLFCVGSPPTVGYDFCIPNANGDLFIPPDFQGTFLFLINKQKPFLHWQHISVDTWVKLFLPFFCPKASSPALICGMFTELWLRMILRIWQKSICQTSMLLEMVLSLTSTNPWLVSICQASNTLVRHKIIYLLL